MNSTIEIILKPKPTDVLCGRGKVCFEHQGNDVFRSLIAQHVDFYKEALTKKAKMQVVEQVVDIVLSRGGRFLVRSDSNICHWIDGGHKQGKKKTGHALRDALRGRVKCVDKLRAEHYSTSQNYIPLKNTPIPSTIQSTNIHCNETTDATSIGSLERSDFISKHYRFIVGEDEPDLIELEPEAEWRHSDLEYNVANDLLAFFHRDDDLLHPYLVPSREIV